MVFNGIKMHFLGVVGLIPWARWLFGRRGIFVLRCAIETATGSFFRYGTMGRMGRMGGMGFLSEQKKKMALS